MLKVLLLAGLCMRVAWAMNCTDVTREQWDARPAKYEEPIYDDILFYFIHHTETEECITQEECKDILKRVQDEDIDDKGHPDIRFNFMVGGDGQVYEGRGWFNRGDHAGNTWDGSAIGIAVVGNYTETSASTTVLNTLSTLMQCGVDEGFLESDYGLHGHSDAACATNCPGDALLTQISTWSNYNGCLSGGCC